MPFANLCITVEITNSFYTGSAYFPIMKLEMPLRVDRVFTMTYD